MGQALYIDPAECQVIWFWSVSWQANPSDSLCSFESHLFFSSITTAFPILFEDRQ